ncbi:MAG: leucine-rich repeat domain-containing protein [Porphyromonas sp.]|uniref:leucine-rich repeat domain-containing protein n=1 Tax=Porphyromonas sp. TaxID=1924944 RepID=UPI002A764F2C|nr:leucine-rich repeat domain-containing protein [Porphyromonas sp.]MDY3111989.1 leucine-rich repeat domain-containing protein [Porphyromonas sp.]
MKHYYSLLTCALSLLLWWGVASLSAQTTINVAEPGTLQKKLSETTDLSSLVIRGSLNADDFGALRSTAGITMLDLSEVKIVAGGSYVGNPNMSERIETVPGTMPGYFLFAGKLAESLTTITLPSSVTRLGIRCLQNGVKLTEINLPSELTYLGEMAFGYCESLTAIELPESIDTLAGATFEGCKALESVELPESVVSMGGSVFSGCETLSEVTLPPTLREIPFATFKGCTSLEELDMPKFLKKIGAFAFEGCTSLSEIQLPQLMRTIEHDAFTGCEALAKVSIASVALETIGDRAFKGCVALKEIMIPAGVTKIGGNAFNGCEALANVILPSKLKTLMGGAFARTAITEVTIPDACEEILYGAFANCKSLETVTLPRSMKKMSDKAFGDCKALKTVIVTNPTPVVADKAEDLAGLADLSAMSALTLIVPEGTKAAYAAADGWKAFANVSEMLTLTAEVSAEKPLEGIITALTTPELYRMVKLTGTITSADLEALTQLPRMQELDLGEVTYDAEANPLEGFNFKDYAQLRKLTYPKQLTTIPASSCVNAMLLEEVVLPEGVTDIEEEAFSYCTALRSIALPQTALNLGESVFHGCASLESIVFPDSIELIPDYGFFDCVSLQEVRFPKKVADIGEQAFTNCSHIRQIWLGESVNEIKSMAFFACDALETITTLREDPPVTPEDAFTEEHYKTVTVVVASEEIKEAYQTADTWRNFKNYKVDPTITAIVQIAEETSTATVYGIAAALYLELADAESLVSIYSPSGLQLASHYLPAGTYELPLAEGLYIVTINQSSYKVYVR